MGAFNPADRLSVEVMDQGCIIYFIELSGENLSFAKYITKTKIARVYCAAYSKPSNRSRLPSGLSAAGSLFTKGQQAMTELSQTDSQFDRFLFASLHENGETPLSVLSALARQDIDAWQEAARLVHLPKDHAVNSLASTIWKSDSERWSPSEASIAAARLIELLPSQHGYRGSPISIDSNSNKLLMWLVYGVIFASVAISGSITQQTTKNEPNHINTVVGQHETVSGPSQGPVAPGPGTD
jgi:hypothetical protein